MDILTQSAHHWKTYVDLTGTPKNLGAFNVSKKVYSAWRTSLYYFFFHFETFRSAKFWLRFSCFSNCNIDWHQRWSPTTPELKPWLLWTQFRSLVEPSVVVERLMSLSNHRHSFNIDEILILECSCIVPLTETPDRLRRLQNSNPDFFELSLGAL